MSRARGRPPARSPGVALATLVFFPRLPYGIIGAVVLAVALHVAAERVEAAGSHR